MQEAQAPRAPHGCGRESGVPLPIRPQRDDAEGAADDENSRPRRNPRGQRPNRSLVRHRRRRGHRRRFCHRHRLSHSHRRSRHRGGHRHGRWRLVQSAPRVRRPWGVGQDRDSSIAAPYPTNSGARWTGRAGAIGAPAGPSRRGLREGLRQSNTEAPQVARGGHHAVAGFRGVVHG